jgi:glycosyltransferase involved in cell wall biosynthesis
MKVFFDSKISSTQVRGGISRLVFETIKALNEKKDLEKIFYRGLYIDEYPYRKEWFKRYYRLKAPNFLNRRLAGFLDDIGVKMFFIANSEKDTIYHSFFHRLPKNHRGPLVVHAYDMIQELFYNMPKAAQFKRKSFNASNLIISISKSTKKDICNIYNIHPDKIIVANPGVNENFLDKESGKANPRKRPYFMYIGARDYKYKNFDILLDAFIKRKYFLDYDLILVGGEKDLTFAQKEKIKNTTSSGRWLYREVCSDEELAELYSGASALVYPSLYEGFGIPVIEALACGCPVLASNRSSLPEAVGDAGLLFNPDDINDLTEKIEKIINDNSLAENLIKKGKIRARQFTWKASADIIYQAYKSL